MLRQTPYFLFDRPDILNANKTRLKQIPVVADDLPRLPS
jgi:hypothetical protein